MKKKIIIIAIITVGCMFIGMINDKKKTNEQTTSTIKETQVPEVSEIPQVTEEVIEVTPASEEIRSDFKQAMDSYEEFMDEYVEFMQKYKENPSDLGLLASYAGYMSKYANMVEKFEKWDDEELNDKELAYYIEVSARVSSKLIGVLD